MHVILIYREEQFFFSSRTGQFDLFHFTGPPARTIGWRDPGFIHTSFLKDLWPNSMYVVMYFVFNESSACQKYPPFITPK